MSNVVAKYNHAKGKNTKTIIKFCTYCKQYSVIEVDKESFDAWVQGDLAQRVWPELRPEDREVIISGLHPSCWKRVFGEV